MRTILTKLQDNEFTVNPLQCDWAIQETNWLGYWLTSIWLKPWKKKTKAVLRMQPPLSLILLRDVQNTEGKPVANYSKKLDSAHINYAAIDKELLWVVVDAELHVHTYQKILELQLHYMEGPHNVIADTFSRFLHSCVSSTLVGNKAANVVSDSESNNRIESSHSLLMDNRDIIDCLLNLPCLSSRKKKEKETNKMKKVF
jgi:hypothetical protein